MEEKYYAAVKSKNDELMHYGVPGMKWGKRKANYNTGNRSAKASKSLNDKETGKQKIKQYINEKSTGEMSKRGKAAIDVLMNGDSDWMGRPIHSDDANTELKNRGKAALERLIYSEEQIDNKKFFGRYNF